MKNSLIVLMLFGIFVSPEEPKINENMKGKWILTDFFEEVHKKREFWTVESKFPSSSFAEIEIGENKMFLRGWYESISPEYVVVGPNKITDSRLSVKIEYVPGDDKIAVKYIRRGELQWEHDYSRKDKQNPTFDIANLHHLIKTNCLIGEYEDLKTGKSVKITAEQIAGSDYNVKTKIDHMCGEWNWMEISTSKGTVLSSWNWNSDTLRINKLTRVPGKEGCKYYKNEAVIKELLLKTMHNNH